MSLSRALPLFLVVACGGDPAPTLLDAGNVDANPQARCLIPASYGALGAQAGSADVTGDNSITVVLAPGPPKDDLFISLTAGSGVFAGGIKPGTFTISGQDASFNTCGLCTTILAHIDAQTGPAKFFFADAGTITLDTATPAAQGAPSKIAGSAQNLHFTEIDLGASGATPVQGGCQTTIESLSFGD
ncbi:MAG TPA: hypothetical protein VFP84_28815 [Kofleriaceae bacterium]|nr:hypothetical protein [Kofleriaceae bacterium]